MTNKPRFTPGPWKFWRHDNQKSPGFAWLAIIHRNENGPYKVCQFDTLYPGMDDSEQETILANAALIATAPEMYYMLCNILNDLETGEYISIADNTAFDIRALLANARGEGSK